MGGSTRRDEAEEREKERGGTEGEREKGRGVVPAERANGLRHTRGRPVLHRQRLHACLELWQGVCWLKGGEWGMGGGGVERVAVRYKGGDVRGWRASKRRCGW